MSDKNKQGAVISFGNFDGVHLGHCHIFNTIKDIARQNNYESAIITFDPHPKKFFFPHTEDFYIVNLQQKISIIKSHGIDNVYVIPFTKEFSSLAAESFIKDILIKKYQVNYIIVGNNCTFGKNKSGDVSLLQHLAAQYNYQVVQLKAFTLENNSCSSSQIRKFIQEGDCINVKKLLGRPYTIEGIVIKGLQRKIGFPTINIRLDNYIKPKFGVYAAKVKIHDHIFNGIVNVGTRPTFNQQDIILEMHIFDFAQDLYGTSLSVQLLDFIRPEKKFNNVEQLQWQIEQDIQFARDIFK